MRAYRKMIAPVALAVMWSANAWALGGLATPDGSGSIRATRVLVVRGADDVRVIAQMRYQGTPGTAVWLVPLPDFSQPADQGVRGEAFAQAGFDALDEATRPVLEGECDGMPTGASQAITQLEQFGPANQMVLPTRFFTVNDIVMGNLTNYLDGLGIVPDMAMADAISRTIDENFMLAAVRIDTADLGVDRIDPIVRLRYPAEAGDQVKLGLRMLEPSTTGNAADLVLYSLDRNRVRTNFTTEELSYDGIRFISPTETDYTQAFDMQVGARQSQMFVYEFAGPVDDSTFADPEVSGLISDAGATFLTRLRARMIPAALRSNLAFVSFREAGAAAVDRTHAVEGFMCGGQVEPDMGPDPEADMGPDPMDDMGMPDPEPNADGGGLVADAGDDDDDGGGGGSSGCVAAPGAHDGWPAALLLSFCLLLPGLRRRR